jgi:hypothetical protein
MGFFSNFFFQRCIALVSLQELNNSSATGSTSDDFKCAELDPHVAGLRNPDPVVKIALDF